MILLIFDELPGDSTSTFTTSQAGQYPIVVTGSDDNNYSFNYVDGTLTIEQAVLNCYGRQQDQNIWRSQS